MGTGPETFVHYVQLQIFLKKKHNRPLECRRNLVLNKNINHAPDRKYSLENLN